MNEGGPADPPPDGAETPPVAGSVPDGGFAAPRDRRRVRHGPVEVEVVDGRARCDATPDSEVSPDLDLDRWGRLAAVAAHDEGVRRPTEMGLRFVDEAEIAQLAGTWLDSPQPTDVLAFPVEAMSWQSRSRHPRRRAVEGGPPLLIGDVVVCPSVAARQAGEAGRRLADELALLVVHGVLHLLGHDHAGPLEARRMERRTRALLARHGRA